jgi:hypothetical protein
MTDPTRQVTVMPWVPNMPGLTLDGGVVPFPDTTTDFVKVLQERGITAKFAVPVSRGGTSGTRPSRSGYPSWSSPATSSSGSKQDYLSS